MKGFQATGKPPGPHGEHTAHQKMKFILLWVIFAFLDPDPDPEPIESGSETVQ
jgi:hypothetical protein